MTSEEIDVAKARKSMAIPVPVDEDWQQIQARIDDIVHVRDEPEPAKAKPRRPARIARPPRPARGPD
jgi:hypothetical protein